MIRFNIIAAISGMRRLMRLPARRNRASPWTSSLAGGRVEAAAGGAAAGADLDRVAIGHCDAHWHADAGPVPDA